jgi:putative membrane protein
MARSSDEGSADPREVGQQEQEPDARFTYANERTFLAWNRTALALVATGVAATALLPRFDFEGGRRLIGLPLIVLGGVLAWTSYQQWQRNTAALAHADRARGRHRRRRVAVGHRGARVRRSRMNVEPDDDPSPHVHEHALPEERTELAWSRSGLALLVCFALLARHVWEGEEGAAAVATVALLALGALGWAGGILHARTVRLHPRHAARPAPATKLRNVALGTVALAVAGVVLSFFPAQ